MSWKISIRSTVSDKSSEDCNHGSVMDVGNDFIGRYYIYIDSCSSVIPEPHNEDEVTSFSVISPTIYVLPEELNSASIDELLFDYYGYHMITGYINGNLKLWRSRSDLSSQWEFVGMLATHQGPIKSISLTDCGQKISTLCSGDSQNTCSTVHIWESVRIAGSGCFILEDTLTFDKEVVALNWLTIGNGQLLLGVCLQNEVCIYAERRSDSPRRMKQGNSLGSDVWFCVSFAHSNSAIRGFVWGPRAMAVILCDRYFSLFSQWSFLACDETPHKAHSGIKAVGLNDCIFIGNDNSCSEGSSERHNSQELNIPMRLSSSDDMMLARATEKGGSSTLTAFYSLQEIVEKLHGPLPAYHPKALLTNILSGNWKRAYVSLKHLAEYSTESALAIPLVPLSTYIEGVLSAQGSQSSDSAPFATSSFQLNQFAFSWGPDASSNTSTSAEFKLSDCMSAIHMLHNKGDINNTEKMQILIILDLLNEIRSPTSAYGSLDEPGRRFWAASRFKQLYSSGRYGSSTSLGDMIFGSEMFVWAFHSDCQENLFTSLLPSEPSWEEMRNIGAGFWYTNASQLRLKMEKLARQQYLKSRDPKACALLYIALNRLQVLAGLFKLSKDEKDKPLVGFLSRNFKEEKNKAASLKNAYVLMGRHQLELAAAFFLLGGDTSSAVTICAKNLGDEQLALVLCRLVEGESGSLEHQLISKHLLPSAIDRGNSWLASFLEWVLGNYAQSFQFMLGVEVHTPGINGSVLSRNEASLLDPSRSEYCMMLAAKNTFKNALGEYNAAALGRWATLIHATALDRCGLPVEALECLSSSLGNFGASDQGRISEIGKSQVTDFLIPSPNNTSCNWINGDVALCMETHTKIGLAMKYISKLLSEHPSWPASDMATLEARVHSELADFQRKLMAGISCLEQKFNLSPLHLINMIACTLSSKGLLFMGHLILCDYYQTSSYEKEAPSESSLLYSISSKIVSRTSEEVSCLFARFITAFSISHFKSKSWFDSPDIATQNRSREAWKFYIQGLQWSLWRLRTIMKLLSDSHTEEFMSISSATLDLYEYCICFGLAWLQRDFKNLSLIIKSTHKYSHGHATDGDKVFDLRNLLHSIGKLLNDYKLGDGTMSGVGLAGNVAHDQIQTLIPMDSKLQIVWAASWRIVSCFLRQQLNSASFSMSESNLSQPESNNMEKQLRLVPIVLARLLRATCAQISWSCMKQFADFLVQNMESESYHSTLAWLEGSNDSHSLPRQGLGKQEAMNLEDESLWDLLSDSKVIRDGLSEEDIQWQRYLKPKPYKEWGEVHATLAGEHEDEGIRNGSPVRGSSSPERSSFTSFGQTKHMFAENVMAFQNPKQVYKIDGELVEALCVNSINQKQVALASNRKGIIYFNWGNGVPQWDHYIWSEADWPQKGWAGSESDNTGKQLRGLGGATSPSARPGKDLTGGGAFGIPGYAGMGASGLGWEIPKEDFVDPPATVNNISTRAFSTHPSKPFFLAGSSNTRVYLWEFGKEKATAAYGVLPASNVPPPYALASISSVQFDKCGQRFATAALDGSLSTWQLEVGGRNNIRPTESSLCFNNHASDVTYVTASGSIIAAAGHSSSGINVVIWDTLAPPSTSRASIMCHEGGAHSLDVFDNDIGSGSISPFIVTGGRGGDVGLHDFRYIATGKTKKHKFFNSSGESDGNTSFIADTGSRNGDRNRDGMLWYIPKAHSGSVTKIRTIPNSSLFLTGSKDGDVKLWDAKTAKLVSHWPKLHEKHTFLQPSSRGFREVVRAAVTDIQVISRGFLSCGGDGSVKMVQLKGSSI